MLERIDILIFVDVFLFKNFDLCNVWKKNKNILDKLSKDWRGKDLWSNHLITAINFSTWGYNIHLKAVSIKWIGLENILYFLSKHIVFSFSVKKSLTFEY